MRVIRLVQEGCPRCIRGSYIVGLPKAASCRFLLLGSQPVIGSLCEHARFESMYSSGYWM